MLAGPTRLELATSGVTGRHSNQLNYDPVIFKVKIENLNSQILTSHSEMVGGTGLEPVTLGL